MEEERGEPASDSWVSGEHRNGNGIEDKDESGSKRLKVGDLDPDAKSRNKQSDGNIGVLQKPDHNSEVSESTDVAKDRKPFTVLETNTCLPKEDDNICVANSENQALLEDTNVDGVSKISSHLKKPKEISLPIARPRGAAELDLLQRDPSLSIPSSEKAVPSKGESDSMRRWMEMKRNGFQTPAQPSTPVVVPPKKKPKVVKKKPEVTRREQEQPQVDRLAYITPGPPIGLLNNLNPAIIRHVRTPKQVLSILRALVGNASDNVTVGEKHDNTNVREPSAFKLPSSGVLDSVNSITDPQQAMSVAFEAATVASQWLEFLHQDLSWRLTAVQKFRDKVQRILTTDLPLLASSRDSSFNKESTLQLMNMDGSSEKTVTETHESKWSRKFEQMNKALYIEETAFKGSLNQVEEMLSRCYDGLNKMKKYLPFSLLLDSSVEKDKNQEASLAIRAAAASIFSTFSFLQSMMKPGPSS